MAEAVTGFHLNTAFPGVTNSPGLVVLTWCVCKIFLHNFESSCSSRILTIGSISKVLYITLPAVDFSTTLLNSNLPLINSTSLGNPRTVDVGIAPVFCEPPSCNTKSIISHSCMVDKALASYGWLVAWIADYFT